MGEHGKDHGGSRDYHKTDNKTFLRRKPGCGDV
jgi:hypothetical protein